MKIAVVFCLFLSLLFSISFLSKKKKVEVPKIHQISSFNLTNQEGKSYGLKELKGKVWVVNFIFSRCQGPCPMITKKMSELQNYFSKYSNINYISITMDPQYDSPKILKEFGSKYHADFHRWQFLTGQQKNILQIARNIFKVPAEENPEMHTTRFILVDSSAYVRGYYDSLDTESFDRLKRDITLIES